MVKLGAEHFNIVQTIVSIGPGICIVNQFEGSTVVVCKPEGYIFSACHPVYGLTCCRAEGLIGINPVCSTGLGCDQVRKNDRSRCDGHTG